MSPALQLDATRTESWHVLMQVITKAVALDPRRRLPLVLTSLPELPEYAFDGPPISFIHGPPGRNIALAAGLRAALPATPLLLIMNADAVTLGMNHLIHAARRNMGMTLMILRAEVTGKVTRSVGKRTSWRVYGIQESIERKATPLELATSLEAASVARGSLEDPGDLARIVHESMLTPGFTMVGVTSAPNLPRGRLSSTQLPEYFEAYRDWSRSLRERIARERPPQDPVAIGAADTTATPRRHVPRHEVRIVGVGGQGVKLAGSVLGTAAGELEGLWTTQRGEYGSATRGGPSLVDVILGSERIGYPRADHPDVLVLLGAKSIEPHAASVKPGGHLIVDADRIDGAGATAIAVPMVRIAIEHTGKPLAAGIVALGCIAAVSDAVALDALKTSISLNLPERLAAANIAAMVAGYEQTRKAMEGNHHG